MKNYRLGRVPAPKLRGQDEGRLRKSRIGFKRIDGKTVAVDQELS